MLNVEKKAELALTKGNTKNGQVLELSFDEMRNTIENKAKDLMVEGKSSSLDSTNKEEVPTANKEELAATTTKQSKLIHLNQKMPRQVVQIIWKYIHYNDSVKKSNLIDTICHELSQSKQSNHNRSCQMTMTHELAQEIRNLFGNGKWFYFLLNSKWTIQKLYFSVAEKLMEQCIIFAKDSKIKKDNLYKCLNTLTSIYQYKAEIRGDIYLLAFINGNMENKLLMAIGQDTVAIKMIKKGNMKGFCCLAEIENEAETLKPLSAEKKTKTSNNCILAYSSDFGQQKLTNQENHYSIFSEVFKQMKIIKPLSLLFWGELSEQTVNLYQQLNDKHETKICLKHMQIDHLILDTYHSLVDDLVQIITKQYFDRFQYKFQNKMEKPSFCPLADGQEAPVHNPQLQPEESSPKLNLWQLLSETLPKIEPGARRFYKLILSLPVGLAGDKLEQELDCNLLKYPQGKDNPEPDESYYIRGLSQGIALSVIKIRDLKKCPYLGDANGIICFGHGHQMLEMKQRLRLLAKITLCPYLIFVIERISSEMRQREQRHQRELVNTLLFKDQSFIYWHIYKYRSGEFIATFQAAINCLASQPSVNCQGALQQVDLHGFLFNHLALELFKRIRKNSTLLELCQKFPQLCQQIYNEAIRRLQLVAGEDLSMMPQLPHELYEYVEPLSNLNTNRWEYFHYNWNSKETREIIVKFMENIKIPHPNNLIKWLKDYIALNQGEQTAMDSIKSLHHRRDGYLNVFEFWANKRLTCILSQLKQQKDLPNALVYQVSSLRRHCEAFWFCQFLQRTQFNINVDKILMPPPARPRLKRGLNGNTESFLPSKRLRLIN